MKLTQRISVALLAALICAGCSSKTVPQQISSDQSGSDTESNQQAAIWKQENHAGVEALSTNNFAQAERHLKAAEAVARGFGFKDVRLAGTLLNLAAACEAQGRFEEAILYGEEAQQVFRRGAGEGDPATSTALIALARIYDKAGKPKEAAQCFEQVIAINDRSGKRSTDEATAVLKEYAEVLKKSGREEEARVVQTRVEAGQ